MLFPLSLRKVIFVDSDQIVRANFAELWNMDLKVSPCSALALALALALLCTDSIYMILFKARPFEQIGVKCLI